MKRMLWGVFALLCWPVLAHAEVQGKEVDYSAGDLTLKGYLAYDDAVEGKRPGVLVVHEWWGHNAYARKRADMLAELGYIALAVDMYGDGKQAEHPDEAGKFAGAVRKNMETAEERFMAAMEFLKKQPQTDGDKIAAIGYCFGGGIVLEMARRGVELEGVASFHGSLLPAGDPAEEGKVKAEILVLHGEADKMAPPEHVEAFKAEMDKAKVKYTFVAYPEVMHSFTNPDADKFAEKFNLPLKYDPEADKDSWNKLKAFLNKLFTEEESGKE